MHLPSPDIHGPPRVLSALDHARLTGLLRRNAVPDDCVEPLDELLSEVQVIAVEGVPATVATMRSELQVIDSGGVERRLTLCYPEAADAAAGRISVLSAMGLGLLGLSIGQVAHWRAPNGQIMDATLQSIVYQPEAAGDFQV